MGGDGGGGGGDSGGVFMPFALFHCCDAEGLVSTLKSILPPFICGLTPLMVILLSASNTMFFTSFPLGGSAGKNGRGGSGGGCVLCGATGFS